MSEFCSEKLRSLCCVSGLLLLLLLLRSTLRSRSCAKVAIVALCSCVVVVVATEVAVFVLCSCVVVIAIELTIQILCKTCDFLCGGVRACLLFSI